MKSTVKTAWIEALRSGNYKQGRYGLRNLSDEYDVMGVLCDLAFQDKVIPEPFKYDGVNKDTGGYAYGDIGDRYSAQTPKSVLGWAGMQWWESNRLIRLNDNGSNFEELANIIDKTFKGE